MEKTKKSPLNSKAELLKILAFVPHSNIPSLATINTFFNRTIKDFKLFYDYTLTFDCGRRGSVLGKPSKGFVDNKGRLTTTKNPEVIINDKKKMIMICTSNKPLKSCATKEALIAISRTSINKLHFKSYRITQQLINQSTPSSARSSPLEIDIITQFTNPLNPLRQSIQLARIQEKSNNRRSRPPPAPSTGTSRCTSSSLLSPLPITNAYSNSSTTSLSLSLSLSSSIYSKRMSAAILGGDDYRDYHFELLLEILNAASFSSLIIGEECVSWSWSNVMTALQHFNTIAHLAVHIGFERHSMPSIKSEKKWLDFIGTHYLNVPQLRSLYCHDDAFLRCMTSLSLYRNLGKHLTFIEEPQYEKGSLLNEAESATDIINGHYIKRSDADELHALEYVRFRCQFAPEHNLSGREVEGAKVFEVSPYDCMFITIPRSAVSFRISGGGSFYEEPDDYKILVPLTNSLRELCVHNISNLYQIDGLYHLQQLKYLVIKKKAKSKEEFMAGIEMVCKHSPIKQITLMPHSRKRDYWQQIEMISVNRSIIQVKHRYNVPVDIPEIANCSTFSDYR